MNNDLNNSINDIIVNITNSKPSELYLKQIIESLPKEILSTGEVWGYTDTEFKDEVYNFIKKKFK